MISLVPGIVAFVLISVFVWVYGNNVGIEREWMRELMAPEVRLGVVRQDELEVLAGTRTRLKKHIRSQPNARKAERVFTAETDLALKSPGDGGAETEAVQSVRTAVARARAGQRCRAEVSALNHANRVMTSHRGNVHARAVLEPRA